MKTDSEILDWLELMHNLHTQVEALYVVDGYEVYLTWDGATMYEFKGKTLREAYSKAMVVSYDRDRRLFCFPTNGS